MTAHSNFQKVIDDAQKGDSIFKKNHILFVDDVEQRREEVTQTKLDLVFNQEERTETIINQIRETTEVEVTDRVEQVINRIDELTQNAVNESKVNGKSTDRDYIYQKVEERLVKDKDIAEIVSEEQLDNDFLYRIFNFSHDELVKVVENNTIAIPNITRQLNGDEEHYFEDFDLDLTNFTFVPVSDDIIRSNLLDPRDKYFETTYEVDFSSINPARVIVTILRDKAEINYEEHSELIVKLISQYFNDLKQRYTDNQIRNLVTSNKYRIVDELYKQLLRHYKVKSNGIIEVVNNVSYEIKRPVFDNKDLLNAHNLFNLLSDEKIKSVVFKGGDKWLTEYFRFDSEPEQKLAIACENDKNIIHWLRPTSTQFDIQYDFDGAKHNYEPDMVIETKDCCYLVEVKRRDQLNDPQVLAKKARGVEYCKIASDWCIANGLKKWTYVIIPHDAITSTSDVLMLMNTFSVK